MAVIPYIEGVVRGIEENGSGSILVLDTNIPGSGTMLPYARVLIGESAAGVREKLSVWNRVRVIAFSRGDLGGHVFEAEGFKKLN